MSQYIQFFIRCEDKFVPMCSYSRSNTIFKAFAYDMPYGKIAPVTEDILRVSHDYLLVEEDGIKARIKLYQDQIESIQHFNNSVIDKLEAINSVTNDICELERDLVEIECTKFFINICNDILMSAKYRDDGNDCPLADYTENTVLYAGIEVPEYPTVDDILDSNK